MPTAPLMLAKHPMPGNHGVAAMPDHPSFPSAPASQAALSYASRRWIYFPSSADHVPTKPLRRRRCGTSQGAPSLVNGCSRERKLGYPALSPKDAPEQAQRDRAQIQRGVEVAAAKQAEKALMLEVPDSV